VTRLRFRTPVFDYNSQSLKTAHALLKITAEPGFLLSYA
jgi:hypothetical protein